MLQQHPSHLSVRDDIIQYIKKDWLLYKPLTSFKVMLQGQYKHYQKTLFFNMVPSRFF